MESTHKKSVYSFCQPGAWQTPTDVAMYQPNQRNSHRLEGTLHLHRSTLVELVVDVVCLRYPYHPGILRRLAGVQVAGEIHATDH